MAETETSPAPATLATVVPQEFHDRPYLKDLMAMPIGPEAYGALFKKLDGAEKLVGKKTGVPEPTAPEAEWDQFFSKLRPETEEAYEIKEADPEFAKVLKSSFFKAGVTKGQAAKIQEALLGSIDERRKAFEAEQQKNDAAFTSLVEKTFGAENKAVLDRTQAALKELTPEPLRPHIDKLSNEHLAILIGVVDAVVRKYGAEDKIGTPGGGAGGGQDKAALQEEGRKLMMDPAYKDSFHPNHEATVAKVRALYEKVGKA